MNEQLSTQRVVSLSIDVALERRTKVAPTPNVLRLAAMFGLGVDEERSLTVLPPTTITLQANSVTFITGPSGGGKTSLLRAIAQRATEHAIKEQHVALTNFATLADLSDQPLIESLCALSKHGDHDAKLTEALQWLNRAGLSDAFVWLRRPCELSDGQRYRAALAHAMALIDTARSDCFHILIADEFGATLDRVAASIIARHLRRWVSRAKTPVAAVVATTHDDMLESLRPNTLIEKSLDGGLTIHRRSTP